MTGRIDNAPALAADREPATGLRDAIGNAGELVDMVSESLRAAAARAASMERRLTELERRLGEVEGGSQELTTRLAVSEQQSARLMSLYVATYQLHATLDPAEVRATIAEIAMNLLGAERFVLLLRAEIEGLCEIALAEGMDPDPTGLFIDGRYFGGDPMVDATLADGTLRIGGMAGSTALAAVPLVVQESTVGALVIFKLLEHKAELVSHDRDMLDLLAAHAASALFAAQVHAVADRKVRTLENLVKLARKGASL